MTIPNHGHGLIWADRWYKALYSYKYLVIPEELLLMGYKVPGPEVWRP